ncbi:hypothetical protein Clacol_010297 [Clathrus columnatus]|uniref:Ribonuclease H n=1 Tax=Clathrus columnatus TaxID=1419009 RepID=A0AAV5ATQ6_9AGAM|nr:hypothetical protein Clacol_010297 [Clathrus columnatus]
MPKAGQFYAVHAGINPGIYNSWEECEKQIKGFPKAAFKKFRTFAEAETFLNYGPSRPSRNTLPTVASSSTTTATIDNPLVKKTYSQKRHEKKKLNEKKEGEVDESGWEVVYTDGACSNNGQTGAVAGIGAIIRVLETHMITKTPLLIKTDSSYSISCIRDWLANWKSRGWKTANGQVVKNKELIVYLSELLDERAQHGQPVKFQHVRGHVGIVGNEAADFLARQGALLPHFSRSFGTSLEDTGIATAEIHGCSGGKDLSVEQNVDNDVEVTTRHLRKLNLLAPINRLPVELFTHIMFLLDPLDPFADVFQRKPNPFYLSYTWVCSHWRSILIQTPNFWTSIELASGKRHGPTQPFIHELLRRSKACELYVTLPTYCKQLPSDMGAIFAKESGRIRILRLAVRVQKEHLVQLISDKRFPALTKLSFMTDNHDLKGFLPVLLSSNRLETLQCNLPRSTTEDVINRLVPIFSRIRNLHLDISTFRGGDFAPLFDLLHNTVSLQNLRVVFRHKWMMNFTERLNLPELRYLSTDNPPFSESVFAPKLSSFEIIYGDEVPETFPESFDFSSIKYLYCMQVWTGSYMIGSKERIFEAELLTPTHTKGFVEGHEDIIPSTTGIYRKSFL